MVQLFFKEQKSKLVLTSSHQLKFKFLEVVKGHAGYHQLPVILWMSKHFEAHKYERKQKRMGIPVFHVITLPIIVNVPCEKKPFSMYFIAF